MSRKNEIIDKAAQMFREKGYRATTLQSLADEMHFTKASLYYYLRSKQDLLFELYDQGMDLAWAALEDIVDTDLPPEEKIRRIIRSYVEVLVNDLAIFTVFFEEKAELPPEKFKAHTAREREYLRQIEIVFEEGIRRGTFVPMDTRIAVQALVGMCSWLCKWYKPSGRLNAEEVAEQFYQLMARGFLSNK